MEGPVKPDRRRRFDRGFHAREGADSRQIRPSLAERSSLEGNRIFVSADPDRRRWHPGRPWDAPTLWPPNSGVSNARELPSHLAHSVGIRSLDR